MLSGLETYILKLKLGGQELPAFFYTEIRTITIYGKTQFKSTAVWFVTVRNYSYVYTLEMHAFKKVFFTMSAVSS